MVVIFWLRKISVSEQDLVWNYVVYIIIIDSLLLNSRGGHCVQVEV